MAPLGSKAAKKRRYDDDEEDDIPSSPRKVTINDTFNEDYEDEEVEEHEDGEDTLHPHSMLTLVKEFGEFVNQQKKDGMQTRFLHRVAGDFIKARDEDEIDIDKFLKSYKKYSALAVKAMTLKTSAECLLEYLDRGETVKMFPDFPKQPPNLLYYYSKKHGIPIAFGQLGTAKTKMLSDTARRQQCELELCEIEEKFLEDLEAFANTHSKSLTETQKVFLEGKIKKYKKKLHGPIPRTPKPKAAKKAKEPQTAFDYYAKTMKDKYTELDDEAREKKLRKKFNKLDEERKELFEKIAMK